MWASLVRGLIEGLIRPLLEWYAHYRQGQVETILEERERREELERRVLIALERDRALRSGPVNNDELRKRLDHAFPPPREPRP